jgi:hypothetical protein
MAVSVLNLLLGFLIVTGGLLGLGMTAQSLFRAILRDKISDMVRTVFHLLARSSPVKLPVTSNSTQLYKDWQDPSAPLYMQYYFWNLTNQCMSLSPLLLLP